MKKWHIYTNVFLIAAIAYLVYDLTGVDKLEKRMQSDYKALSYILEAQFKKIEKENYFTFQSIASANSKNFNHEDSLYSRIDSTKVTVTNNCLVDGSTLIPLDSSVYSEAVKVEQLQKFSPYFDTSKVWTDYINSFVKKLYLKNYLKKYGNCRKGYLHDFNVRFITDGNQVNMGIAPTNFTIEDYEEVWVNGRKKKIAKDGTYKVYLNKKGKQELNISYKTGRDANERLFTEELNLKIDVK